MFDGFSSLLKPENTSEFSPRFSVSFSRSRRNEFSPSSLQVASGENFWGFYEAIEKSRGNRKKLVVAMLWGDGGLRSAAVEIRGPSTQNPPLATAYRFESGHRHHVGANVISFAPTFLQKSERAHAAAPPFQTEPAVAGLRFGAAASRRFCLIARKYWTQPALPHRIFAIRVHSFCG